MQVMNSGDEIKIVAEWNQYRALDLEMVRKLMKGNVILDTRNLLEPEKARAIGFIIEGVGRK